MKPRDFSATPNKITELSRCEIFVFGSNLKGCHAGGAARVAMESSAQNGVLVLAPRVGVMLFQPCKVVWKLLNLT